MAAKITDASISSMTVEISQITVSGKAMTLSVFRQLPAWEFVTGRAGALRLWDAQLRPWGFINYHWPGCSTATHHAHYVGVLFGECYRIDFEEETVLEYYREQGLAEEAARQAYVPLILRLARLPQLYIAV